MARRPVAEDLFIGEGDGTRLIGGRERITGEIVFPLPSGSSRARYERVELAPEGTLWAFTVQRFRPKPPFAGDGDEASFRPYAVGYVELPGEIAVETRIEVDDPALLALGQAMRATTQVLRRDAGGDEVVTYAFRPLDSAGGAA